GDRSRSHWGSARVAILFVGARSQPRPRDASGEAEIVEPGRLIAGEPRGQDLALPRSRGCLETLKLGYDRFKRVRSRDAILGRDALPRQQEAQEIARRHRLDLGTQALDRIVMDARQQPALAPFVDLLLILRSSARGAFREVTEPPAHRKAFN